MYAAEVEVRCGVRLARSSRKEGDVEGIVESGTRASLAMPATRPRWLGVDWRVWKASRSAWDAEKS